MSSEKKLIDEMRTLYRNRLEEAVGQLSELDLTDKKGNVLVAPGLRVVQDKSGLEFSVRNANEKGAVLNPPEAPRFEVPEPPQAALFSSGTVIEVDPSIFDTSGETTGTGRSQPRTSGEPGAHGAGAVYVSKDKLKRHYSVQT